MRMTTRRGTNSSIHGFVDDCCLPTISAGERDLERGEGEREREKKKNKIAGEPGKISPLLELNLLSKSSTRRWNEERLQDCFDHKLVVILGAKLVELLPTLSSTN